METQNSQTAHLRGEKPAQQMDILFQETYQDHSHQHCSGPHQSNSVPIFNPCPDPRASSGDKPTQQSAHQQNST